MFEESSKFKSELKKFYSDNKDQILEPYEINLDKVHNLRSLESIITCSTFQRYINTRREEEDSSFQIDSDFIDDLYLN